MLLSILMISSESKHLKTLGEVLARLEAAGLRLKREKCGFMLSSVDYLGHVISSEGLSRNPEKIVPFSMPQPREVQHLRSFLGLLNYYSKFLPNPSTTLAPLYQLLQAKVK